MNIQEIKKALNDGAMNKSREAGLLKVMVKGAQSITGYTMPGYGTGVANSVGRATEQIGRRNMANAALQGAKGIGAKFTRGAANMAGDLIPGTVDLVHGALGTAGNAVASTFWKRSKPFRGFLDVMEKGSPITNAARKVIDDDLGFGYAKQYYGEAAADADRRFKEIVTDNGRIDAAPGSAADRLIAANRVAQGMSEGIGNIAGMAVTGRALGALKYLKYLKNLKGAKQTANIARSVSRPASRPAGLLTREKAIGDALGTASYGSYGAYTGYDNHLKSQFSDEVGRAIDSGNASEQGLAQALVVGVDTNRMTPDLAYKIMLSMARLSMARGGSDPDTLNSALTYLHENGMFDDDMLDRLNSELSSSAGGAD